MKFTVRHYRRSDFRILWEIDQACFPSGLSYTPLELKTYIHRPQALTLVAEAEAPPAQAVKQDPAKQEAHGESAIAGFVVADHKGRIGHIITIDVCAEVRQRGVGSALLEAVEARLRACNCACVRLETAVDNVPALSFYKRHGYTVIRSIPRYYSNGVDALLMEKHLHSALSPDNLLR